VSPGRMIKYSLLAFALFALVARAPARDAGGKRWSTRVEQKNSVKGRTVTATRNVGIKSAKQKAITEYIRLATPKALLEGREENVSRILEARDRLVISMATLSERVEGDYLIMEFEVILDKKRLDTLLRAEGLLPSRALPRTFVVARVSDRGEKIKSAWDQAPGEGRAFNACEARIAATFSGYGFEVVSPRPDAAAVEVEMIVNPRGKEQVERVVKGLKQDFGAEALVVGFAELIVIEEGKDGGPQTIELAARIAVGDLEKGVTVFSDRLHNRAEVKGALARTRALESVCDEAAERAVEAMFASFSEKEYEPGERREILVRVQGVGSYSAMKAIERKIGDEGPGVVSATLSRMSSSEIEFRVVATVDSQVLADWLARNRVEDLAFAVVSVNETSVSVFAVAPR